MATTLAIFKAIADFKSLTDDARKARLELQRLKRVDEGTTESFVAGQKDVAESLDDTTESRDLSTEATERSTEAEKSNATTVNAVVTELQNLTRAQRDQLRIENDVAISEARRARAEREYLTLSQDVTASTEAQAGALRTLRIETVRAGDAQHRFDLLSTRTGGLGGGPPGRGVSTDVGSFFRQIQNAAAGILGVLTLITPTINLIIAGLVGLIGLATAAVTGVAAIGAAALAVGGAMAIAAYRWRNLLRGMTEDTHGLQGAILAIEADAFDALTGLIDHFRQAGSASGSFWDSVVNGADILIDRVVPIFERIGDAVMNFVDAINGEVGANSPFLDFVRTWAEEWKTLGEIANQDLLPGGPGFFEKYEAPAKAFVEGIANVINGIRKMSRAGLGLNMDQLAEFIGNVFDALSRLVQYFPMFSNALVGVGLALSEFLVDMGDVASAAFEVGSMILSGIVEPLARLVLFITDHVLNLPIISWLASLAGGWAVAAFGLSKLSFGLVSFRSLVSGRWLFGIINAFKVFRLELALGASKMEALAAVAGPKLVTVFTKVSGVLQGIGRSIANTFAGMFGGTGDISNRAAGLLGSVASIGAVAGAYLLVTSSLNKVAEVEEKLHARNEDLVDSFADGNITLAQARAGIDAYARSLIDSMGWFEKAQFALGSVIQHPTRIFSAPTPEEMARLDAADDLQEQLTATLDEYVQNAKEGVEATGALTDEQLRNLNIVRDSPGGMAKFNEFLRALTTSYQNGSISAGTYISTLDRLGVSMNGFGTQVDTQALKIEGAGYTISQALSEVADNADFATAGIERFAENAGEDVVSFRQEAIDAFTDLEGGIAGSGDKITEWFQEQKDFIQSWKNETADAFNFVSSSFANLADDGVLSSDKFIDALQEQADAAKEYLRNLQELRAAGASPQLIQDIKDAGIGFAPQLAELTKGDVDSTVDQLNRLEATGARVGKTIANEFADALGVTLEKLTAAIEVMTAKYLDVPVSKVKERVRNLVNGVNDETEKVKDRSVSVRVDFESPGGAQRGAFERGQAGRGQMGGAFGTGTSLQPEFAKQLGFDPASIRKLEQTARTGFKRVGSQVIAGFQQGLNISQTRNSLLDTIKSNMGELVQGVEDILGIASPSKKFFDIGRSIMDGLRDGIADSVAPVNQELERVWDDVLTIFDKAREIAASLGDSVRNQLLPPLRDLISVLKNVPDVHIALAMDTTKAREAMEKFVDSLESKGLVLTGATTTPGSSTSHQQRHTGGPAGTSPTYASGPPKSDEVDTRLRLGEYVLSVPSVEGLGGMGVVHQMAENAKHRRRLFHSGGAVEDGSTGRSARRRRKYDTNEPSSKRLLHDGGSIEEIDETTTRHLFHSGGTVEEFDAPDLEYVAKSLMSMRNMEATVELPKQEFTQPLVAGGDVGGLTGLTAAAVRFASNVRALFGNIGMGGKTIRPIAGTSTWSQHSYGNAIDVMAAYPGELHRAIAFWADANRRALAIHWLGADPWFPSPLRDHFSHVHADFYPQYTGDPYTDGHPYHRGGLVKSRRGYVQEGEFVFDRPAVEDIGVPTLQRLHEGGVPLDTADTGDQPIDPRIPAVITRIPRVVKDIMKGVVDAITAVTTEREARGWQRAMTREILAPGFGDQQHTLIRNAFEAVLDYNGREVAAEVRVALRQFANNREMPRPIEFPVKEDKAAKTDDEGVPAGEPPRALLGRTAESIRLAKQYGKDMVTKKWNANEYNPLLQLWTRESGWRWWAENPSSGAYGIPQSLPGTKMAAAGGDWRTNPLTQMQWGLSYIQARYGSPHAALAHSNATGWYKRGGKVKERFGVVHEDEFVLRAGAARALGTATLDQVNENPMAFADMFRTGFSGAALNAVPGVSVNDAVGSSSSRQVLNLHIDGTIIARTVELHAEENEIRLPSR